MSSLRTRTVMTLGGQTGFGNGFGGCCVRRYDVTYEIQAPYAQFSFETGRLNLDASARYDQGSAFGSIAGGAQRTMDVNGDGVISPPETRAFVVDNSHPSPVDYDYEYWSYSAGANYLHHGQSRWVRALQPRLACQCRSALVRSCRLDDHRRLWSTKTRRSMPWIRWRRGSRCRNIPWVPGNLDVFATFFYTEAEENNVDITIVPLTFFNREYEAKGLELLATYGIGNFRFDGNFTYTDAEITKDFINPAVVGNTPQRLPELLYRFTAAYSALRAISTWASISSARPTGLATTANGVHIPGYAYVNLFASYRVSEHLSVALNVNNAFDEIVVDNIDVGSITPGSSIVTTPRAISGRSSTLQVLFSF